MLFMITLTSIIELHQNTMYNYKSKRVYIQLTKLLDQIEKYRTLFYFDATAKYVNTFLILSEPNTSKKSDSMPDMPFLRNKKMWKIAQTLLLSRIKCAICIIYHFDKKNFVFFLLGLSLDYLWLLVTLCQQYLHSFSNDKNTPCVKTTEPFRVTSVIYLLRDSKEKHTFAKFPRQI